MGFGGYHIVQYGLVSLLRCSWPCLCSYHVYCCDCRWNWMLLWLPRQTEVEPLCLQKKTKWGRILNLLPDMFAKSRFMTTLQPDNIAIQRKHKPLAELMLISLFMTVVFRNVLIGAKFMAIQWNNTLISWSFISPVIKPGDNAKHIHMVAQ